jgi:hypothetical protein
VGSFRLFFVNDCIGPPGSHLGAVLEHNSTPTTSSGRL